MKKIYISSIFIICLSFFAKAQYDHQNIELVGNWFDSTQVAENTYGIKYNSVWGWVNPKNNVEYGILGSGKGTSIIDLSDPAHPKRVAFVKGRRAFCIWREYKTYQNYLYAISDDASPNSFQIIDMSYLPDSVHVVYDGTDIFEKGHTIFIDADKMYIGYAKGPNIPKGVSSMSVYSLTNPEKPVLLRSLNDDDSLVGYAHDMFVRNDTVYASCGNQGLYIYFYDKSANKFIPINVLGSYPNQGYNHSSALTKDGKTLVFCDEVPRDRSVKVLDVSDIHNLSIATTFKSTEGATAHNPYIKDNKYVIIAYYQDGLQIFDISDPKNPYRTGYFDTDTIDGIKNNYNINGSPYHGNWGAYIDLPSRLILASDMQNGLFVLNPTIALGITDNKNIPSISLALYPNPATDHVSVKFTLTNSDRITYEVFDITGKRILSIIKNERAGTIQEAISLTSISKGMYALKISGKGIYGSAKFVKE